MTVKELIEDLKQYPEDMPVLLSKDEEGNGFLVTHETGEYLGRDENGYMWEIYNEEDIDDYKEEGYEMDDLQEVVVIWP